MADASCSGPSPFKRLVDHQSRDVSHHQDRLLDRNAGQAHSSFRSAPQHQQAQSADNFAAFMNPSPNVLPGMPHDPANRLAAHAAALRQPISPVHRQPDLLLPQQARASFPAPDVSNWAADFNSRFSPQQMRSSPSPSSALAPTSAQMAQRPMHTVFPAFGQSFGAPLYGGLAAASGLTGPQTVPGGADSDFDQEMSKWISSHGAANMSQVDAAMDQMARELQLNETALAEDEERGAAVAEKAAAHVPTALAQNQSTTTSSPRYTDLETPEIGNLSLQEPQPLDRAQLDHDHDQYQHQHQHQHPREGLEEEQPRLDDETATRGRSAVSEAAERLLETVQHESSEKWQNSVFLSLMRDFKDGRKDIVNDEIRALDQAGKPVSGPDHEPAP